MYSINSMINTIRQLEESLNQAELKYRLTGDEKDYLSIKQQIRDLFSDSEFKNNINYLNTHSENLSEKNLMAEISKKAILCGTNDSLIQKINVLEIELRKIRKKITHEEYKDALKNLITLRNKFAKKIGFENYLELKYYEHGLDKDVLINKIDTSIHNFQKKYTEFMNSDSKLNIPQRAFSIDEQFELAQNTVADIGLDLNLSQIKFHMEKDERKVSRACVVPISVPEEIHVIVNPQEVFMNLVVCVMHEIGHAINFSYINPQLNYLFKNPYNAALNEAMSIFFEKLIMSEEWFEKYMNQPYSYLNKKECLVIPLDICCFKFEEIIYNDMTCDLDEVWKDIKEEIIPGFEFNWTDHHFFVSEPGYTASYLMAELLSNVIKKYIKNEYNGLLTPNTGLFLKENIFEQGKLVNIQKLLNKIEFHNLI